MYSKISLLFCLCLFFQNLLAQDTKEFSPAPNQVLYGIQIPFRFPAVPLGNSYKILWKKEIATSSSSEWNTIALQSPGTILKKGVSFGDTIVWKYQAYNQGGNLIYTSTTQRFFLAPIPDYLMNFRLRITQPRSGDALYFIDNPGAAWDRQGNLIWFYQPDSENRRIMDMRMTREGNISLISVLSPYGRAVILSPEMDTLFDAHTAGWKNPLFPYLTFHHHFESLEDGTLLMVADIKHRPSSKELNMGAGSARKYPQIVLNMTKTGKVNWIWESDKYLSLEDNACYGHINSVAYKPKTGELLVSMKDLSRIVYTRMPSASSILSLNGINERSDKKKIAMSSPRNPVVPADTNAQPGRLQNLGEASQTPTSNRAIPKPSIRGVEGILGPFSGQHSVQFSPSGNLLVFNNNSYNPHAKYSTLLEMKLPQKPEDDSQIVWQHILQFQDTLPKKSMGRGGVQVCENGELVTFMGQISRIFESDTAQKILWMGILEHYPDSVRSWQNAPGYKAFRSSSLYPAFYTSEVIESKELGNCIRISNLGSEADTYQVLDTKGNSLLKKNIPGGEQAVIKILEKWPKQIKIQSDLNPSGTQSLKL
jgi:hypothetical protein